ncbi:2-deoxy-D-gluconate 3-dehydrogenase [Pacificitalea manganoxidans]|uniref:2-deoxy-D-gluconate 3-dehydrogenase n=1 Tax=Pacificitalea manganoxidans TaxID=1411902 RepID=A0A291LYI9_9RHOB|nr:2-deoxy-D-gluconate 3-dehydrogenase [Pacificitalea manganoxidans]
MEAIVTGLNPQSAAQVGFDLAGRTALVTGASSGLGVHFARCLAGHGARVAVAARRAEKVATLAEEINASGGEAEALRLDVTDAASVAEAFEGRCFDIVVNNAGIAFNGPALDTPEQDWRQVIDTDLTGVFLVSQAAARAMVAAQRGGSIINIASILGKRVAGGLSAYAAAKAAVVQLTRANALEWARHDIRVNAICPGYIETDINRDFFATEAGQKLVRRIPIRRLGQMEDLSAPLLLLASDHSRFMTGSELVVDGGHLVTSL